MILWYVFMGPGVVFGLLLALLLTPFRDEGEIVGPVVYGCGFAFTVLFWLAVLSAAAYWLASLL